jgi:KUP system potassium uptake protein
MPAPVASRAPRPPGVPRRNGRPGTPASHHAGRAALTLAALGVVFGDIGTSPLYALQTVFSADHHAIAPTRDGVFGVISLVFWSITIVVSLKYLTFIMRADNNGEGGIMALISLVQQVRGRSRRATFALIVLGIFGASLFYGDGMITPAISVLSAVEGLEVVSPGMDQLVVPITLAILLALFSIQHYGTGVVGRFFGPIMAVWFGVLALAGVHEIAHRPEVLRGLSPTYAINFFADHPGTAFIALGSVVLVVTGAEALYADMGHFGRSPIRRAWFVAAFPALTLNYLGQAALILRSPRAVENPFFLLVPEWGRIPMVVLATIATVIASQAVISGAFSVTRQAVQLGFLPRLTIQHTSAQEVGQVYVPAINWGIFAAIVMLVLGFESSSRLASAYGIAVTGTLAIDTLLFFYVVRALWRKPLWMAVGGAAAFLTVDLAFFSANVPKVVHGGWFPLSIALVVFTILTTWQRGRQIVTANRTAQEGPLQAFVDVLHAAQPPVLRVPGTAVFLNPTIETTPLAMRANVEHNHVLHEHVVILSVFTRPVPHVPVTERIAIDDLGYADDGIFHVSAYFGFQDDVDVPRALEVACGKGLDIRPPDLARATYFISRVTIRRTDAPGMHPWRKKLFIAISRNAANPVEYFCLPIERTIVMGSHVYV